MSIMLNWICFQSADNLETAVFYFLKTFFALH